MRKELLSTFDEIYILNLHGSSRIGEKTPEGGKDENVFDIQQGVAIAIYVKLEKPLKEKKVRYADVWGLRNAKYTYLRKNDVTSTDWLVLEPQAPYYFFVPKDFALQDEYDKYWSIPDIFKFYSSGVKTHRDHFVVGFTKEEIIQRLKLFTGDLTNDLVKERLKLKDTRDWDFNSAREKTKQIEWRKIIRSYSYRPFDIRFICYDQNLIEKGCVRLDLMRNFFEDNLALCTMRQVVGDSFRHALVTNVINDLNILTSHHVSQATFPLFLYGTSDIPKGTLLKMPKPERTPNFTPEFLQAIKSALGTEPTPEEILYYIYAVLYSPTYRKRYEEFLKIDFPRVPLPSDLEQFKHLSELGKELVELHLLKHPSLSETEIGFPVSGSNTVERVKYDEENSRVYFNKEQYFGGVSKAVWEYQIGGYQVLAKYLMYRKKRKLSLEEIKHYMRVAKVIARTIVVQEKVEKVYGLVAMG